MQPRQTSPSRYLGLLRRRANCFQDQKAPYLAKGKWIHALKYGRMESYSIDLALFLLLLVCASLCLIDMLSRHLLDLALLTAPVAASLSAIDTFYPSGLSDVSWITNASLGSYGGIYEAPADEPSLPPSPYGVYDYCTMPHPRVEEYKLPVAVENGSVEARLVYLEYLQRHQRRTPYNILPGGEVRPPQLINSLATSPS